MFYIPFAVSSILSDPMGRYIIVVGHLYQLRLILASIYAPNCDHENFFVNLFSQIPDMTTHNLILAVDTNCVFSNLDRSSNKDTPKSKSAKKY